MFVLRGKFILFSAIESEGRPANNVWHIGFNSLGVQFKAVKISFKYSLKLTFYQFIPPYF